MEKLPTILIPPALSDLEFPQRLAVLRQTVSPIGTHHKAPKGHSETQFERELWNYFPGKIHAGLMLCRPGGAQPHVPDLAYIDPDTHLHIDIEIDEPYSHVSRQPLHYLGNRKDEQRNQAFLAQGWVIIRLSEQQVVKFPAGCCKAIASVIAMLTGNSGIMTSFRQIPTLKPERRWTFTEATQMAEQERREQYLAQASKKLTQDSQMDGFGNLPRDRKNKLLMNRNLVFYCPICGESVQWKSHYVQCSNCRYDNFVF